MTNLEYAKEITKKLTGKEFHEKLMQSYGNNANDIYVINQAVVSGYIITKKINALATMGVSIPDDMIYSINMLMDTIYVITFDTRSLDNLHLQTIVNEVKMIINDLTFNTDSITDELLISKYSTLNNILNSFEVQDGSI